MYSGIHSYIYSYMQLVVYMWMGIIITGLCVNRYKMFLFYSVKPAGFIHPP